MGPNLCCSLSLEWTAAIATVLLPLPSCLTSPALPCPSSCCCCLAPSFETRRLTPMTARHAFQHYILQDAFFLSVFSRAYAAALDKLDASMSSRPRDASTRDMAAPACHQQQQCEMARPVLQCLLLSVHEELRLHSAYAARWV